MANIKWEKPMRIPILSLIFIFVLAGCNFPGFSSEDPSQMPPDDPTSQPADTELPTKDPTATVTTESTLEPAPEPTQAPLPKIPSHCRPYPDQLYPALSDGWFIDKSWVKCGGSSEPIEVSAPVEGLFWDYSNQTGKIAYGLAYEPGPEDLDVWIGDYSLYVYDYRTDMSTLWLKGGVLDAKWAPEIQSSGIQPLAVLLGDGTVAIVTGPEQIETLVNIDRYDREMDACCITWSPNEEKLSYVKNEIMYVIPTVPQEPRMMAENAFGPATWVLDQQLLLFPSSVIKLAQVDGSGPFIPNIPDGNRVWTMPESRLLWNATEKMVIFDEFHVSGMIESTTWVYQFSEDFETVTELYSFERKDSSFLIAWYELGESVITSTGKRIPVQLSSESQTYEGMIDRIYQGRYTLWLEGDPYPSISVSLGARIKDTDGDRASILDLDEGLRVRITGVEIAEGRGFLAEEIQILKSE
jgi:hypothetical protein